MTASTDPRSSAPVVCSACGAENRATRFFCSACGAYLRREDDTWENLPGSGEGNGGRSPAINPPPVPPPAALSGPGRQQPPPSAYLEGPGQGTRAPRTVQPSFPGDHPGGDLRLNWEPYPARPVNRRRRRRGRALGVLLTLILLMVLGAFGALVYRTLSSAPPAAAVSTTTSLVAGVEGEVDSPNPDASTTTTTSEKSAATTTTVLPIPSADPRPPDAIQASSELEATEGATYVVENLLDGELGTAWQEGTEDNGPGEWIKLTFSRPVRLALLEIANGYQKDERRFRGNARIENLTIVYSDGSVQAASLKDTRGYQNIDLAAKETESLELIIESVFPGERWEDLAVSEIRVYEAAE